MKMEQSKSELPSTSSPVQPSLTEIQSKPSNSEKKLISVMAYPGQGDGPAVRIEFTEPIALDAGTFGTVFVATLVKTEETIAIKKVLQDKRYRNRELDIMKRLHHCNIVELKYYFLEKEKEGTKLNLILEYLPQSLRKVLKHYRKFKLKMQLTFIRVFMYQLLRGLNYIHSYGICHRDIKPQNLLLCYSSGILKICDFGSAKKLVKDDPNVSYICSRYYRAPELFFGAVNYTTSIDLWSSGCILGEFFIGRALFVANTGIEMLVEMVKILGTPQPQQIRNMNSKWDKFELPELKPVNMSTVFGAGVPSEAVELLSRLLVWEPDLRINSGQACCHAFFDPLRDPAAKLPNGNPLPPLFNLTRHELAIDPNLKDVWIPKWVNHPKQ